MSIEDPRRLRDEDDASLAELRREIASFAEKRPSPEALARIASAAGLPAEAARPDAPAEPGSSALSPLGKALLGAGGAVLGVAAVLVWFRGGAPALRTDSAASSAPIAAPASAAEKLDPSTPKAGELVRRREGASSVPSSPDFVAPAPEIPAEVPPGPGAPALERAAPPQQDAARAPERAVAPASPGEQRARPDARSPVESPGSPRAAARATETELLRDARLVLDRNPQIALSFAEQHRRDYPNGSFTQERELIAITALVRLGQTSSAAARAARFRESYPRSPYAASLDRLVPP